MEYELNSPLYVADQYVRFTNKTVFLTGKAGTGKTTFLKNLRQHTSKRIAIAAPTGVAAINAGGVTLHSLFQLPFGPILPIDNNQLLADRKFTSEKIKTLKSIDLLVIDEISMVRADTMDAIDQILRRFRNRFLPFGGVQLLMIGDLHQLAPIIKEEEWELLRPYYSSIFFFESIALKNSQFITIELTRIFRQSDDLFIQLLNKVRNNQLDEQTIELLNTRYQPDILLRPQDEIIHLTTHVQAAQSINEDRMSKLKTEAFVFKATIDGEFPESMYPNEEVLTLKVGTQVMFTKNDTGKLFFNGKLGKVVELSKDEVKVQCKDESYPLVVRKVNWDNIKYVLNENKELNEQMVGTFSQLPIKPAWAITIHKSQGLTFDKAIIDAQSSFAHGQVYVALSRCRTFEGLVLSTPIHSRSIKKDHTIHQFHETIENTPFNLEQLEADKRNNQVTLLNELFSMAAMRKSIDYFSRVLQEHASHFKSTVGLDIQRIQNDFDQNVFAVAEKFQIPLQGYLTATTLPESNSELQERIKKAALYFIDRLQKELFTKIKELPLDADNKEIKKKIIQSQEICLNTIFEKIHVFKSVQNGFTAESYIKAKANASIDFDTIKLESSSKNRLKNKNADNPDLYEQIKNWRDDKASELGYEKYMILNQKAINEIVSDLPGNLMALSKIKGIGSKKIEQYGEELLDIILQFCERNKLSPHVDHSEPKTKKKVIKGQTQQITFDMFKAGKSLQQIAQERMLAIGTIESHLAEFVTKGLVGAVDIIDKNKLSHIYTLLQENSKMSSSELKEKLGASYSYGEIKIAIAGIKALGEI